MSARRADTEAALNSRARTTQEYRTGFCNGCEHRDRQTVAFLREQAAFLRGGKGPSDSASAAIAEAFANAIERGEHVEAQP